MNINKHGLGFCPHCGSLEKPEVVKGIDGTLTAVLRPGVQGFKRFEKIYSDCQMVYCKGCGAMMIGSTDQRFLWNARNPPDMVEDDLTTPAVWQNQNDAYAMMSMFEASCEALKILCPDLVGKLYSKNKMAQFVSFVASLAMHRADVSKKELDQLRASWAEIEKYVEECKRTRPEKAP